jgi:hypothetical protein
MKIVVTTVRTLAAALVLTLSLQAAVKPKMSVFKTSTCGCCGKWVEHMKTAGFDVQVTDVPSTAEYRRKYGVPENLLSCHTAVVNGYAIEGHVPADDVKRLLKTRPKAKGLAVPGMPIGSPGMEQGPRRQAYSVLLFNADGSATEFQSYSAQ